MMRKLLILMVVLLCRVQAQEVSGTTNVNFDFSPDDVNPSLNWLLQNSNSVSRTDALYAMIDGSLTGLSETAYSDDYVALALDSAARNTNTAARAAALTNYTDNVSATNIYSVIYPNAVISSAVISTNSAHWMRYDLSSYVGTNNSAIVLVQLKPLDTPDVGTFRVSPVLETNSPIWYDGIAVSSGVEVGGNYRLLGFTGEDGWLWVNYRNADPDRVEFRLLAAVINKGDE
ncbi:hypothetical protein EGM51_10620 [Verrucomicrobia bacterium S94]|nr:hypothetical protein EGM51_10620 [Verrucomicrobia bacterium S94]